MIKKTSLVVSVTFAALVLITLAGCYTSKFGSDGIPNYNADQFIVGGGRQIEYKAPTKGTAMLVDISGRKMMITKTLEQDELFSFGAPGHVTSPVDTSIDLKQSKLVLYFFPSKESPCKPSK